MAEIVAVGLHRQAVDADDTLFFLGCIVIALIVIIVVTSHIQDSIGDEILSCSVTFNDSSHHILGNILIIGQKLLGVFRQTIAAISETGVVIMRTNARIESYPLNDCLRIEPFYLGIGVKFVEIAHTQSKVCISEQLYGFSLLDAHKERIYIFLDSTLLQQTRKSACRFFERGHISDGLDHVVFFAEQFVVDDLRIADDNTTRIKVVVEGFAFAKELRRKQQVEFLYAFLRIFSVKASAIAHRNGRFNDHYRVGIDPQNKVYNIFDVMCIEKILYGIVIGWSCNDNKVCILVRC